MSTSALPLRKSRSDIYVYYMYVKYICQTRTIRGARGGRGAGTSVSPLQYGDDPRRGLFCRGQDQQAEAAGDGRSGAVGVGGRDRVPKRSEDGDVRGHGECRAARDLM